MRFVLLVVAIELAVVGRWHPAANEVDERELAEYQRVTG
jgi:hypothetical protein